MDQDRYGARPRWQKLLFGLPPAILLLLVGGYWTLLSWGVIGDTKSETFSVIGPIIAGFGVALGWVVLQRRH
ncbi:hypothetical protein RB608_27050 [Nocardioides sp. LHD-245]|uniref:hypothetical protein n=1 Tax=Nocardioides sp. LHD-245 TaxID=3051387 RepID=UPI0027E1E5CC|nr:hypothetical protein [Nocardioides sp. LHD-245]